MAGIADKPWQITPFDSDDMLLIRARLMAENGSCFFTEGGEYIFLSDADCAVLRAHGLDLEARELCRHDFRPFMH